MKIYTLWHEGDDGIPWLLNAVDEYCVEENGWPSAYLTDKAKPHVREVVIDLSEKAIKEVFAPPPIKGTITTP